MAVACERRRWFSMVCSDLAWTICSLVGLEASSLSCIIVSMRTIDDKRHVVCCVTRMLKPLVVRPVLQNKNLKLLIFITCTNLKTKIVINHEVIWLKKIHKSICICFSVLSICFESYQGLCTPPNADSQGHSVRLIPYSSGSLIYVASIWGSGGSWERVDYSWLKTTMWLTKAKSY